MAHDTDQFETLGNFLTSPPSWLMRSGISLISVFFLLFLIITWMVSFPDKIVSEATIRTTLPLLDVVVNNSGYINTITVKTNSYVKTGQIIGILNNPGDFKEIIKLENLLDFKETNMGNFSLFNNLGEIQPLFLTWKHALIDYIHYENQNVVYKQVQALGEEKEYVSTLNKELLSRQEIYAEENELVKEDFDRSQTLYNQKVISPQEKDTKKIAWLQAKRSFSGATEDILRNDIRMSQIDVEKIKLMTDRENLLAEKKSILQKSEIELRLAISLWKRKYVIFSPISGKLIWETNLAPGKYLTGGKPIGTVIPEGKAQQIIAICLTPVSGSGRIEKGNIVKIEFDAFPFEEYGRVEANVIEISPLPLSGRNDQYFYQVMASLPDSLISDYGIKIPFQQNLTGKALILTNKRTLFNRIFDGIIKKLDRT